MVESGGFVCRHGLSNICCMLFVGPIVLVGTTAIFTFEGLMISYFGACMVCSLKEVCGVVG